MDTRQMIPGRTGVVLLCLILITSLAWAHDPFEAATAQTMAGDYQSALKEYEAFLAEHPRDRLSPIAAMAAGNIHYLALDDLDAALGFYERVLSKYPQSPWATEAARRSAECLEAREEWAQAGAAYVKALALASRAGAESPAAISARGAAAGASAGAMATWINEVSLLAANCFYQLGDRQRVIETYEQVLKGSLPPESRATTLYRLADCYDSAGEPRKAAERYVQVIENHPWADEFALALSRRELITRHHTLDWDIYETYNRIKPPHRGIPYDEIMRECDTVLAGGGSQALHMAAEYAKILAGTVLETNYTEGSRKLRSFLNNLPAEYAIPNSEAMLDHLSHGAELESAVRDYPEDATALRRLGTVYLRSRSSAKAVEMFERALALDPDNDEILLNLGYAYAAEGRADDAAEPFRTYLERHPQNTDVLNQIGYTYIGQGNPEGALPYFLRYVELAPDEANAHDSLGECYLRAGRPEDAKREYEKAIELDPSFFNSHFMLIGIYRQLKDEQKAVEACRRFLELAPTGPQAEQARAILQELGS